MDKPNLGSSAALFNLPGAVAAVRARDMVFWHLHARWRAAEDEFETETTYEGPENELLFGAATTAQDDMLAQGVFTASALLAKIEAVTKDFGAHGLDREVQPGVTVLDVVKWDLERIAKTEIFGVHSIAD